MRRKPESWEAYNARAHRQLMVFLAVVVVGIALAYAITALVGVL